MLALGMQVIAVAAENAEVREVCHRNTPNVVHVADVGHIRGRDLVPVIKRRKFTVILIGGGSPCQGNSELNMQRKGVKDPRTIGAYHVTRIERESYATPLRKKESNYLRSVHSSRMWHQLRGKSLNITPNWWGHRRCT